MFALQYRYWHKDQTLHIPKLLPLPDSNSTTGHQPLGWNLVTDRNEVVAKVIFLHLSVILFTGGGSASMHAGIPNPPGPGRHPPGADTPSLTRQTPLDQADPLQTRQNPPGADPSGPGRPPQSRPRDQADPPPEADSSIRFTSGRYASYWNAFLFDAGI